MYVCVCENSALDDYNYARDIQGPCHRQRRYVCVCMYAYVCVDVCMYMYAHEMFSCARCVIDSEGMYVCVCV